MQRAPPIFAALDLGTNNCRLLIAAPRADGGFKVLDSFSRIVRLGERLGATGMLADGAVERTMAALAVCAGKLARWGVTDYWAVTTEACRQARNGDQFIARVRRETGIALEIIPAAEEARLAVAGCASLFDHGDGSALVFDIGGGSTELVWLKLGPPATFEIEAWLSLPLGVVALAEAFGGHEVGPETYRAMVAFVEKQLAAAPLPDGLRERYSPARMHLIGTSGTVTTLAGIHLSLERYERGRVDGLWLTDAEMMAACRRVCAMSHGERAEHGCIGLERADLVIPGAAILEGIHNAWPGPRIRVADRGLREGMLLALMAQGARRKPADGAGPRKRRARRRRQRRRKGSAEGSV